MRISFLVFCILFSLTGKAQKPNAFFLSDSVMIGSEIRLVLSYTHDSKEDIIFPDSSSDFSPFTYISTEFFETKSNGKKSVDSAIYTLVSYSLDSILSIVPYITYVKSGKKVSADTLKVALKSLVKNRPLREIEPKRTVEIFKINKELNVPLLIYYILGFIFVTVVLMLIFGEWTLRQYRLWRFDRYHQKFAQNFKNQTIAPKNTENIQKALSSWKNHLEWLDHHPVSTMSTSEIFEVYDDERLESALKMFDAAIFGKVIGDRIPFAYHILQEFVRKRYKIERETIERSR